MPDPRCKIDWFYDGYQQVWIYYAADEDPYDLCEPIAHAIAHAETVAAVDAAIEQVVGERGYRVETTPGPSHEDPLALHVTVALIRA